MKRAPYSDRCRPHDRGLSLAARSLRELLGSHAMVCTLLLGILAATSGCLLSRPQTAPTINDGTIVAQQLIIQSDFDLPQQHRLIQELVAQRDDIAQALDMPVSEQPIHVHLFGSPAVYESFIQRRFPQLPRRRAFFVETEKDLTVYAHWGDRVAEDLRHEVAHGYLHASIRNLPLWLDEGLAEYFEVPPGLSGLNRPHVQLLLEELESGRWQPNLARLERLSSAGNMTQRDYAESWAWVYWLLETSEDRKVVLTNALLRLRRDGVGISLRPELERREGSPERLLLAHLQVLGAPP